ncbi:MAG: efflux RND transporter periplasmic adaptor subunit [Pseudomonadota bacterium]
MKTLIHEKPYLLSLVIIIALSVWMLTGNSQETQMQESDALDEKQEVTSTPKVKAIVSQAQEVARRISLYGQTEPDRIVTVKARVDGKISRIAVERGLAVEKNQIVIFIEEEQRPLAVKQAKAELEQRKIEYQGTQQLKNKGFNAEARLAETKAKWQEAKTRLKQAELELTWTQIAVPFNGVLNERFVEVGDYVVPGQALFEVIDAEPLVIRASIPESEIKHLKIGMPGKAVFLNKTFPGQVRFIAKKADEQTRTFNVELAIKNPGYLLPVGASATLELDIENIYAHQIVPSLLALNNKGEMGIKTIDEQRQVAFRHVDIVSSNNEGIWVSGLEQQENIITLGQGYVRDGDKVHATYGVNNFSKTVQATASDSPVITGGAQ